MSSHAQDKLIDLGFSLLVLGAGIGAVWWLGNKAVEKVSTAVNNTAAAIPNVIKPTSDQNIFYRIDSAPFDLWDDGQLNNSYTLGGAIYDWINPGVKI